MKDEAVATTHERHLQHQGNVAPEQANQQAKGYQIGVKRATSRP
jgi:hypothetical protein